MRTATARLKVESHPAPAEEPDIASLVWLGLSSRQKRLPPVLFYDEAGSAWFEKISELSEYYLTRTEHALLVEHAQEIACYASGRMALVELGSGSARKTRALIEALIPRQGSLTYMPVDISAAALAASARLLLRDYPELRVLAQASDYGAGIERMGQYGFSQKMVLFLGSSIGNLDWSDAVGFLSDVRRQLRPHDYLLLGADMQKDLRTLEAAYNDAEGVTAQFNLNVLRRINRELEADFAVEDFAHRAFFNPDESRIEMHLMSRRRQVARIRKLRASFAFDRGETIHTESSYKYKDWQLDLMCGLAGLRLVERWQDQRLPYSLSLLTPL